MDAKWSISKPDVWMFKVRVLRIVVFNRDTEKFEKLLKYIGPSKREDVIHPSKESLNRKCLLSIIHSNKEVCNPSLVKGLTAT